jgi:hypothetical protein
VGLPRGCEMTVTITIVEAFFIGGLCIIPIILLLGSVEQLTISIEKALERMRVRRFSKAIKARIER